MISGCKPLGPSSFSYLTASRFWPFLTRWFQRCTFISVPKRALNLFFWTYVVCTSLPNKLTVKPCMATDFVGWTGLDIRYVVQLRSFVGQPLGALLPNARRIFLEFLSLVGIVGETTVIPLRLSVLLSLSTGFVIPSSSSIPTPFMKSLPFRKVRCSSVFYC